MTWWRAFREITRKEVIQHIKTARLLTVGILFILALVLTTIVFPLVFEEVFGGDIEQILSEGSAQNQIFGFFLGASSFIPFIGGLFYIALVSIILTADGITSEWQRRTIFLVLSKPVPRSAFVMGKYAGAMIAVIVPMLVLCILDYALLTVIFRGAPSGEAVLRFMGGLGILVLGAGAYGAMALFVSTLVRSTVAAFILALGMWIVVLPLLGVPGTIMIAIDASNGLVDVSAWKYEIFRLLSPGDLMGAATRIVLDLDPDAEVFFNSIGPQRIWLSPVMLVAQIAGYLGLSLFVVGRRDFE